MSDTYEPRHPHEYDGSDLAPIFDPEGRCLVCYRLVSDRELAERDATIARLRQDIKDWRRLSAELRAERDSLAASLEEAREELEGQRARKETAREALASTTHAALRERAELSELRARVEAAVAELREFVAQGGYEFEAKTAPEAFLQQELKDIISRVRVILAPPEAPEGETT